MSTLWTMRQSSVEIAIETVLDLEAASREVRTQGGSLPFTIERTDRVAMKWGLATVVHRTRPTGAPSARFIPEQNQLEFHASADELNAVDLLFLSYLLLETQLQRNGFITLHAAAVERAGLGALLLGHSGAGKTTTALTLCRDFNCRLIGNDLVVVGGLGDPVAIAGTTHIRLRYSSVSSVLPDLLQMFDEGTTDPWRAKKDFAPEELGISLSDAPARVVSAIFVHVDSEYGKIVIAPGDTWIHRGNLYENALRHIRAIATPWLVGSERALGPFVPSLDDPALHEARTATLNHLLKRSYYIAGTLSDVTKHISDHLIEASPRERGSG